MVKLLDKAKLAKAGSVRVRGLLQSGRPRTGSFVRSTSSRTVVRVRMLQPLSTVLRGFEQKSFLVFAAITEKAAKEFFVPEGSVAESNPF